MAHQLDFSNNRANMAFVGEVPWHGLGRPLRQGAPIEEWLVAAGMDWQLKETPVMFFNSGSFRYFKGRKVLLRSDTQSDLSIVSDAYKVVQPREVMEFYRDLVADNGMELDTAGVLFGGRKYWALARTGESTRIKGQDEVRGYVLLATSCDGSMATTAMLTSVRVVCNNTLSFAVEGEKSGGRVAIHHNQTFDAAAVKASLGVCKSSWATFENQMHALADRKVTRSEAVDFLIRLVGDPSLPVEEQTTATAKSVTKLLALHEGGGRGSNYRSAEGTLWGLVNAVTEQVDHHRRTRTPDSRLDRAWFGDGQLTKARAFNDALTLLAA